MSDKIKEPPDETIIWGYPSSVSSESKKGVKMENVSDDVPCIPNSNERSITVLLPDATNVIPCTSVTDLSLIHI